MKQSIGIGSVVDDGKGDYLRVGGEKINSNFTELYGNLGDGNIPHPAGAWKNHSEAAISPIFGQAFNLNTSTSPITVTLPVGQAADYGKVIRLRDVWGTWGTNAVTLVPSGTNTIKGASITRRLTRDYQDVELVFASPGSWEYLDNKMINRLSTSDLATVSKREFIATSGQKDFADVFGETPYNSSNIEVYRRGNLLYYGQEFSADSDYGSIGTGDTIVALDGKSIRLRVPCEAGDTVTVVTYLDDLAVYRTSYVARTIKVMNEASLQTSVAGQTWVGDLTKKREWTLADFGLTENDGQLNPFATEILINGRQLTLAGTGGLPAFGCEDTDGNERPGNTEQDCIMGGGQWVESGIDYSIMKDERERFSIIKIAETLENNDLLTLRWYNNDIGTVMPWEEIKANADRYYLNNEYRFNRSNKLRYNDYNNPNPCTVETELTTEENIKFTDVVSLLESVWPVGSVYINAHNKANPEDFMGFGKWVPYAQGKSIVGWVDGTDGNFSYYSGSCSVTPINTPGGSGGTVKHTISKDEIPTLTSTDKVLIKDENGDVLIGQCLLDPDDSGPGYRHYREDVLNSNVNVTPTAISLLQPYVTVAAWLRVA